MSGGGGSSGTQRVEQTNVPDWARPQFQEMLGRGIALSEAEYQPFTGQRQAGFTPMQEQAFGQAQGQQVAPQLGAASGIAGIAAQQGLQAGQFQPGTFTPMAAQAPQLQQFQLGAPIGVGTQSFTQPGAAEQFMSPYMQQVVGIQQREAQRQADIAGTQRGAQAVRAGAFGGSRQAIMDAEAQRNLAQQMGDIQATGSQAAFQQAQDLFGREQQMGLQAQMANQQAGLTAGQANLQSMLQTQGLGAQTGMQAQLANQQAMMDAQRAFEQSRQFGSELGLRGGAQALQGAQALGQLGQQQFGQQMDITGLQRDIGREQQMQEQRRLEQQFADFQTQRDFPYQQIGFLSDLLRGTGSSTRTIYQPPSPSFAQTAVGLGTAAAGLGGMMAKGGEVRYADGGITGLLGDQELAQTAQNPAQGPMMQMAAQQQMAENAALRAAAPEGMPQPMVEDTVDAVEAGMIIEMQKAMNEGDRQRAEALAETIERRREERMAQEEMGIAAVADGSIGEIPDGGITGMEPVMAAEGGELRYQAGGPIVLPAGTPRWMVEQTRMENPGREVRSEDEGALYRGIGRALTYSSDVEAQRTRERANQAGAGRGIEAGPTAEQLAQAPRPAVPSVITPPAVDVPPSPDTEVAPMEQGIAAAAAPGIDFFRQQQVAAGFDPAAARRGQEEGIAALQTARRAAAEGAEADLEKEIAERGVLGEEREKRAREGLEGLEGKKGEAKSMALFQAGLSILSADPSRGGLAAIGEGALKGLGAYKGDLEKLETRREKLMDKLDTLDDLRRQERMADSKERRSIRQRIREVEVEGAKDTLQLSKDFDVDIPRAMASDVFKAWGTEYTATKNRAALAARSAGTAEDKKITAAEAAFQRDPEAAALRKQLENPMGMLDPAAQQRAIARLREIQADKYNQFDVTMVEPSAGADMTGFRMIGVKQ